MKLTVINNGRDAGNLVIDNARIIYRNFTGAPSQYNREGDRNFSLILNDQDIVDALIADGWNVKIKAPREEGDMPFMHLPVKVRFNDWGPTVYLRSGKNMVKLDEESIAQLDHIDIEFVDMELRPYDWQRPDGASGRSAYLASMCVTQKVDRYMARYAEEEAPEEMPWD